MTESTIDLSIVIPIYNTEQFLTGCLDAILRTIRPEYRFEVILVDDGSTDRSGAVCDWYAGKYPDIFRVIHKANGGSASARKAGWNSACGKYITVCDSDDWVEPDMYGKLLDVATSTDADIVICDFALVYASGVRKNVTFGLQNPVIQELLLGQSLADNRLNSSCNKLFRRSIFTCNNLEWTPGVNLGEDGLMWTRILCVPGLKISYLPEVLYNYRRRAGEDTYTNRLTPDKWRQLKRVHELRKEILSDTLADSACDVVFAGLRTRELPKKELRKFIADNVSLFRCAPTTPKRILALMAKFGSIRLTRVLVAGIYQYVYK